MGSQGSMDSLPDRASQRSCQRHSFSSVDTNLFDGFDVYTAADEIRIGSARVAKVAEEYARTSSGGRTEKGRAEQRAPADADVPTGVAATVPASLVANGGGHLTIAERNDHTGMSV